MCLSLQTPIAYTDVCTTIHILSKKKVRKLFSEIPSDYNNNEWV